jgi:hypothetical protein
MLDRGHQPSQSERIPPRVGERFAPRVVVGLVLVAGAVVWALARGLHYYGVSPVHLAYDFDQPPALLLLVSAWLWYRGRRR